MIDARASPEDGEAEALARVGEAAAALEALREPGERAAQAIDDAFARAGSSLARSLARAAADGEISLAELARAVIGTLNGLFGGAGPGGGSGWIGALAQGVTGLLAGVFSGRAAGGGAPSAPPVDLRALAAPRAPVRTTRVERDRLVERRETRTLEGAAPVVVNLTLQGPAEGLLRSEAQLAQTLARAAALGARRL